MMPVEDGSWASNITFGFFVTYAARTFRYVRNFKVAHTFKEA